MEYRMGSFKIVDLGDGLWYVFHLTDRWSATFEYSEDVEVIVDAPMSKWNKDIKKRKRF